MHLVKQVAYLFFFFLVQLKKYFCAIRTEEFGGLWTSFSKRGSLMSSSWYEGYSIEK